MRRHTRMTGRAAVLFDLASSRRSAAATGGPSDGGGGDNKGTAKPKDGERPMAGPNGLNQPIYGEKFGQRVMQAPVFPGQAPTYHGSNESVDFEQAPGGGFSPEAFGGAVSRDPRPIGSFEFRGGVTAPRPAHFAQQEAQAAGEREKQRAAEAERTKAAAEAKDDPIASTRQAFKRVVEDVAGKVGETFGDDDRPPGSVNEADRNFGTGGAAPPPPPPPGTAAGGAAEGAKYKKSKDVFTTGRVTLTDKFGGDPNKQIITWWENIWWNWIKYLYTRDILVGKDKYGNYFTASWYFLRSRHEVRKCKRIDKKKAFQPYGALPTDDRLWEAWLRNWRNDPPTIEECAAGRKRQSLHMGVHQLEGEETEDTLVRLLAQTRNGGSVLQELDDDQKYANRVLQATDVRAKEADVSKEHDSTWTAGFMRGDVFYNEEEVENMRQSLAHVYRDREWQALEMKRQTRLNKAPYPIGKPKEGDDLTSPFAMGMPMTQYYDRTDGHVPMHQGVAELTTPDLEKLRAECDALEDERLSLRKELGLMDIGDFREGREAIDKGYDPFQPPPTSGRWKPKCWQETWGTGGANPY